MARGGYTFEQIKQMDNTQLLYLHHYQLLLQKDQQEFLSTALGIVWDKKSLVEKTENDSSKPIEKLFIPLSVAVNPDILDYVKAQFKMTTSAKGPVFIGGGEYTPKPHEVVTSMSDLSKEDFMKLMGKRAL